VQNGRGKGNILNTFRLSIFHSFFFNYSSQIFSFLVSLILARIITPEEYGTYALALVFAGLGDLLKNFGVVDYLIKEKNLTKGKLENAFGLLIITCAVTALLLLGIATLVGDFYDNETLTLLIQLLSLNVIIAPLGSVTNAILRRNSQFKNLGIAQLCTQIGGLLVTLILAYLGWGVFALAWGLIANGVFIIISYHLLRVSETPSLPKFNNLKPILSYSIFATLSGVVAHFGRTSQNWIMGKALNMESIGFYTRGQTTVSLYDEIITKSLSPVISSFFAHTNRNDAKELVVQYQKLIQVESSIAWPFFAFLGFYADVIVDLLWGPQWIFVGTFLVYLCIGKGVGVLTSFASNVLLMIGESATLFRVNLLLNIIIIIAILLVVKDGVIAIAITTATVGASCRFILFFGCMKKHIGLTLRGLFKSVFSSMIIALVLTALMFSFSYLDLYDSRLFEMFFSAFILFFTWLLLHYLMKTYFYKEFLHKYTVSIINKIKK